MQQKIKRCESMIAYLISTSAFQGHSSHGERMSICVPNSEVVAISELSNIVGRMEVYAGQEDAENLNYMEKFFLKKCDEYCIDMDDFESWLRDEDDSVCSEDDSCV